MKACTETYYRKLWLLDAFKDLMVFVGTHFEPEICFEMNYKTDQVRVQLVREVKDRMTFCAYAIGPESGDSYYEIFTSTWWYNNIEGEGSTPETRISWGSDPQRMIGTKYHKEHTQIKLQHIVNIRESEYCILDYPLQEEQIFQELTRFPVLEEEVLEDFMSTGQYIMQDVSKFCAFSFHEGHICNEITETKKESMVQSVQDALWGLYADEVQRIEEMKEYRKQREQFNESK